MSEKDFEAMRVAITEAANWLSSVIEKQESMQWDYLIVAVPVDSQLTRIPMMTSVQPEALPHFLRFIEVAYSTSAKAGRVLDNRRPEGEPS